MKEYYNDVHKEYSRQIELMKLGIFNAALLAVETFTDYESVKKFVEQTVYDMEIVRTLEAIKANYDKKVGEVEDEQTE